MKVKGILIGEILLDKFWHISASQKNSIFFSNYILAKATSENCCELNLAKSTNLKKIYTFLMRLRITMTIIDIFFANQVFDDEVSSSLVQDYFLNTLKKRSYFRR